MTTTNLMELFRQMRHILMKVKKEQDKSKEEMREKEVLVVMLEIKEVKCVF